MSKIKWRKATGRMQATPIDVKESKGQVTEGIFVAKVEHFGDNDSILYYVKEATVDKEPIEGEVGSFFGTTVLDARIKELDPTVGDYLRITYQGKVRPQSGGKPYHVFEVEVGEVEEEEETAPKKPAKKTTPKEADTDQGEAADDIPF